ncbi:hypothetical protein LTR10_000423 [Elasticomyces elasticus]|nr:hypothetical protein LTR10_000423 [Elasticomyces elasticus]KAK4980327.1 hypothetical protein LTR42_000634 [Elasticomyces elasticus]
MSSTTATESAAENEGESRLMNLPPELRELIWSFVVGQPEPVVCYMARRVVIATDARPDRMATVRQFKVVPRLPSLARTSRVLAEEALPLYFRDNIFLFHLDRLSVYDCKRWLEEIGCHCETISNQTTFGLDRNMKVRLEFWMKNRQPAAVEFTTCTNQRDFQVTFPETLENECNCWVEEAADYARFYADRGTDSEEVQLSIFAGFLETVIEKAWLPRGPATNGIECTDCRKMKHLKWGSRDD